jgi:6-phosphogluconolactonase
MTPFLIYVGTYTGPKSKGIYRLRMDSASGALTGVELAAEMTNPSFVAVHPSRRFLYAVGETGGAGGKGGVAAFAMSAETGKLDALNQQSTGGAGPCHLTVDREGRNVLATNYGSGSVCVLPVGADGRLSAASSVIQHQGSGPDPKRQAGPHAHSVNLDAAARFALVCDLGLDKVFVYRYDAAGGKLAPNDLPSASVAPGAGPRHISLHPTLPIVYVINEMSSTVTAFEYDAARGALRERQTVPTLPGDFKEASSTAEVRVHPSGRFLYGSNRGHDSIAIFAIDPRTGDLTARGYQSTLGREPRHFAIDPTGAHLVAANQNSDTLVVFRIDPETGALTPAGIAAQVPAPVCVTFVPPGR